MRLLTDRALAALKSWYSSADRIANDMFLPRNTYVKYKCLGLIWHDRIVTNRKTPYDEV